MRRQVDKSAGQNRHVIAGVQLFLVYDLSVYDGIQDLRFFYLFRTGGQEVSVNDSDISKLPFFQSTQLIFPPLGISRAPGISVDQFPDIYDFLWVPATFRCPVRIDTCQAAVHAKERISLYNGSIASGSQYSARVQQRSERPGILVAFRPQQLRITIVGEGWQHGNDMLRLY